MIKSSQVDQPLGSVLHGEVWLVAHHVVDEVEAVGRQGGGEHVLVVGRLQHHLHSHSVIIIVVVASSPPRHH